MTRLEKCTLCRADKDYISGVRQCGKFICSQCAVKQFRFNRDKKRPIATKNANRDKKTSLGPRLVL